MTADNVVICGLTAAGKTTHAKLLAAELGYDYVSGTATLAKLCGVPVGNDPPRWAEIADAVSARRHDGIDAALEDELVRLCTERTRQVFDVWALPWTTDDPRLIRVWIESDLDSRTKKAYVSQGPNPVRSLPQCRTFIAEKDDANRALFLRTIGFDLFADHDVFHLKLDNSAFITEATRAASDRGIAAFAPFVSAAVTAARDAPQAAHLFELEQACTFSQQVVVGGSVLSQ